MASHHLSQRYTLPLSTRDAADEFIANLGLGCVADAKGAEDVVLCVLHVLLLFLQVLFPLPRHLIPQSELDSLIDGQGREVDVVWVSRQPRLSCMRHRGTKMGARTLGVECDLLAVPPCPPRVHAAVPHFAFHFIERIALVGQHAEKGRTSRTGSAEDEELRVSVNNTGVSLGFYFAHHFTRFDLTANLVQDRLVFVSCWLHILVLKTGSYPPSMLSLAEGA